MGTFYCNTFIVSVVEDSTTHTFTIAISGKNWGKM